MLLLLKSETHVDGHNRGSSWVHDYIRRAAKFAAYKHQGQTRKDGKTPYISHPVRVANILGREAGVNDHELIAASLLHDTLEDTHTTRDELAAAFGRRVADLVVELTNGNARPNDKHAWQLAHELSAGAAMIKIADKTANLRDIITAPPVKWSAEKKRRYFEQARELVQKIGEAHQGLADLFEATYLDGVAKIAQANCNKL